MVSHAECGCTAGVFDQTETRKSAVKPQIKKPIELSAQSAFFVRLNLKNNTAERRKGNLTSVKCEIALGIVANKDFFG